MESRTEPSWHNTTHHYHIGIKLSSWLMYKFTYKLTSISTGTYSRRTILKGIHAKLGVCLNNRVRSGIDQVGIILLVLVTGQTHPTPVPITGRYFLALGHRLPNPTHTSYENNLYIIKYSDIHPKKKWPSWYIYWVVP